MRCQHSNFCIDYGQFDHYTKRVSVVIFSQPYTTDGRNRDCGLKPAKQIFNFFGCLVSKPIFLFRHGYKTPSLRETLFLIILPPCHSIKTYSSAMYIWITASSARGFPEGETIVDFALTPSPVTCVIDMTWINMTGVLAYSFRSRDSKK